MNNNIKFRGRVTNDELIKLYSESGIFVFPSSLEGYGLTLIEAMKCGMAVVASDIPSSKELINDGVDGFLFEKNNSGMLADKLKKLLLDKSLQEKISSNAIKRSEKFSNWEDACRKYYDLYLGAIK